MPDLNCAQVQDATVKIQSAYRGFQTRKQMKVEKDSDTRDVIATTSDSSETEDESLPDLKDAEVENATLKIQSAYRGFQTRKQMMLLRLQSRYSRHIKVSKLGRWFKSTRR